MAESWGTDDSLCDISPTLFGDGVVDVEDLKILAEYIGKDVDDPTRIAHWALDETEGDIAHDSGGENDGVVAGGAVWQPEAGAVGGTLELDGVNDLVSTPSVLNPADGPFSVLEWIKGGEPGQVLISQVDGENWLVADALDGSLATGLVPPPGRNPIPPLVSDTVITDGNWHRIGFVWDGISRALYVDDILVAADAQEVPASCSGDMNIGCGKDMTPGTFFSGLIDDVRIYNRAVTP